ncbi:tRNA (adenosine(37)-N6)-threonylcarbamoyltransferase complex dimerization subunit type 1 TsaB [Dongia mobilis]|jgi:tRNA threonylcarbamoyladenosine biosynthesis protein TsaB|uniref:tRNA (adenosine(37)-N6)-threonylcarbamoyltransferase complex dimerization subunit type 1 TsaB n=1 Tax=Dongia sp. TaxID=1977262 RepID=UPI0026F2E946
MTASHDDRLILAMDAAGATCSVALGVTYGANRPWDLLMLAARKVDLRHGHAAILVPMVDEVIRAAGRTLTAVDAIAVGIGPGGFTGLRIALATARGFGLALDKPVIGITNFQAAAANLNAAERAAHAGDILVFIDSRREEPYVAHLAADLSLRAVPRFMSLAEIGGLVDLAQPAIVTGDGLALWPSDWPGTTRATPSSADAEAVLRLAADPAQRFAHKAVPLYLREPDVSLPKAV